MPNTSLMARAPRPAVAPRPRSADAHDPAPRARRHRSPELVALYRRRRLAAAALGGLAFVALIAVAVLPAGPGGVPAVAAGSAPAPPSPVAASEASSRVHVARRGDTLWAIAHRYRGEVSHDDYLDVLIDRNGGTRIEVGQAVQLP